MLGNAASPSGRPRTGRAETGARMRGSSAGVVQLGTAVFQEIVVGEYLLVSGKTRVDINDLDDFLFTPGSDKYLPARSDNLTSAGKSESLLDASLGADPVAEDPENAVLQRPGYGRLLGIVQHQIGGVADQLDTLECHCSRQLGKEVVEANLQTNLHSFERGDGGRSIPRVEQLLLPAEQVNLAVGQQRRGATGSKQNRGVEQSRRADSAITFGKSRDYRDSGSVSQPLQARDGRTLDRVFGKTGKLGSRAEAVSRVAEFGKNNQVGSRARERGFHLGEVRRPSAELRSELKEADAHEPI